MIENLPADFREAGADFRLSQQKKNLVRIPLFRRQKTVLRGSVKRKGENIELKINSLLLHLINQTVPAVQITRKRFLILAGARHDPLVESVHAEQIVTLRADGAGVLGGEGREIAVA